MHILKIFHSQLFYLLFTCYDNKHIDYHIEFFRTGLNAVIKKWLSNGCKETPKEINELQANTKTRDNLSSCFYCQLFTKLLFIKSGSNYNFKYILTLYILVFKPFY